jgi:hypothetical protein
MLLGFKTVEAHSVLGHAHDIGSRIVLAIARFCNGRCHRSLSRGGHQSAHLAARLAMPSLAFRSACKNQRRSHVAIEGKMLCRVRQRHPLAPFSRRAASHFGTRPTVPVCGSLSPPSSATAVINAAVLASGIGVHRRRRGGQFEDYHSRRRTRPTAFSCPCRRSDALSCAVTLTASHLSLPRRSSLRHGSRVNAFVLATGFVRVRVCFHLCFRQCGFLSAAVAACSVRQHFVEAPEPNPAFETDAFQRRALSCAAQRTC